jgi:hypothetical protein
MGYGCGDRDFLLNQWEVVKSKKQFRGFGVMEYLMNLQCNLPVNSLLRRLLVLFFFY